MREQIGRTEVFCPDCRATHPATQYREGERIVGSVDCPAAPREATLSEHADLFLRFRGQAGSDTDLAPDGGAPFFLHHLPVTDDCDCRCPVCYAAAGAGGGSGHISLEAATATAIAARNSGARTVILVGGEPTLHPRLVELIGVLRRQKLRVWMATNGLRLAGEPQLAGRLKRAGLQKVNLQLDTFDRETHLALRGHDNIDAKLAAAALVTAAGLDLGLTCTVTSRNLAELPSFCRRVLTWPAPPRTIVLQAAGHVGRYDLDDGPPITREAIVMELIGGQAIPGLKDSDFWAIPVFRPLQVYVHPDCGAYTVALVRAGIIETSAPYADTDRFLRLASSSPAGRRAGTRRRHLVMLALRSMRPGGFSLLARHVADRLRGRAGVAVVFIGAGAFLRGDFQDMSRIRRCGSAALTADGSESLCAHHGRNACRGV